MRKRALPPYVRPEEACSPTDAVTISNWPGAGNLLNPSQLEMVDKGRTDLTFACFCLIEGFTRIILGETGIK